VYRLQWENSASRQLLSSAATAEIMSALSEIENQLTHGADTAGESRDPGTRFLFEAPLAVTFQVNARLQVVLVKRVKIRDQE
jgi:hypothetical protein